MWVPYLSRSLATRQWETAGLWKELENPSAISTLCLILILSSVLELCIP